MSRLVIVSLVDDLAWMVSPGDVDNFYGDTLKDLTRFGWRTRENGEKIATDDEVDEVDDAKGDILQISQWDLVIDNDGAQP